MNQSYKDNLDSMGAFIHTLKTEEITRKLQTGMRRNRNVDLVIIDDLMFIAHFTKIIVIFLFEDKSFKMDCNNLTREVYPNLIDEH